MRFTVLTVQHLLLMITPAGLLPTAVYIYNRSGNLLFNNRGCTEAWDGTDKGSKLPAGTHYYIIKAGTQVLSGWVCIIC
jgi:gliding motility-associated-like protein